MNTTLPVHCLLNSLAYPARKDMVRSIFAKAALYNLDELQDCVVTLPYPDSFWKTIVNELEEYVKFPKLWTDPETECFHNLRLVLLQDLPKQKEVAYKFVHEVYPQSKSIPDWTYENAFDVLRRNPNTVETYLASIQPKSEGYIKMKKREYLHLISEKATAAEGLKLATTLLRTQYHSVVANYMYWPASKSLIVALLKQKLEYRRHIHSLYDEGWVPENYIDLCRSPLTWEAD